ncbi:Glia-derived nexin [Thelohanellus kitauei]|uniref:Glia-derived nexin n=1 Tax=Thelohanellus kitauei TaxID=669202 RepID=A0A0C2MXK3_THEKT|nr:Glia-derived nexin [Thelohanellus kitauei]
MSVMGVNNFTSSILNQIYSFQNTTGNIAVSSIGLSVLIGVINMGLNGRSYDQISPFLWREFENIFDIECRNISNEEMTKIRDLCHLYSMINSTIFYSCEISNDYEIKSNRIGLNKIKVNNSNPISASNQMNDWIYLKTRSSTLNIFNESILLENRLIFIQTAFYHIDWKTNFNPEFTEQEIFYDDQGVPLQVSMMNHKNYERIFDFQHYNFKIIFRSLSHDSMFSAIILPNTGHSVESVLRILNVFP